VHTEKKPALFALRAALGVWDTSLDSAGLESVFSSPTITVPGVLQNAVSKIDGGGLGSCGRTGRGRRMEDGEQKWMLQQEEQEEDKLTVVVVGALLAFFTSLGSVEVPGFPPRLRLWCNPTKAGRAVHGGSHQSAGSAPLLWAVLVLLTPRRPESQRPKPTQTTPFFATPMFSRFIFVAHLPVLATFGPIHPIFPGPASCLPQTVQHSTAAKQNTGVIRWRF
jgi:hypothetical protein